MKRAACVWSLLFVASLAACGDGSTGQVPTGLIDADSSADTTSDTVPDSDTADVDASSETSDADASSDTSDADAGLDADASAEIGPDADAGLDGDAGSDADAGSDSDTADADTADVPCQPVTCAEAGATCGELSDGCGALLNCGDCPTGESCGADGQPNQCGDGPCTPTTCLAEGVVCGALPNGCGTVLECGSCAANEDCSEGLCVCVPTSCASQNATCGAIPDGCGGTLECGDCDPGETCGAQTANQCGQGPCVPTDCSAAGATCGSIADGCGNTLECGDCSAPESCGGAGVANVCGCAPTTCSAVGAECGSIDDGCGNTLDCGDCTGSEICGGGGVANVCDCTPTTCSAVGAECGSVADGCGNTLDCGGCTASETCGGGGVANECGCTPTTCSAVGAECGSISDGCGSPLDCGGCIASETCGGGGVANECGCTPTTCSAVGAECGPVADGCGNTVECGSCTTPGTCGADGTPNICGSCAEVCPPGSSCDGGGVCVPDNVDGLVLDVKTVDISGEVTLNGAVPALLPGCSLGSADESLHIRFTEVTHGYNFDVINVCEDGFTFGALTIFPGTYRISVRGDNVEDTPLPTEFYVVYDALEISTTTTSLVLDVETVDISGAVTLNGVTPSLLPGCSLGSADESLHIRFTEVTQGYSFEVINVCEDGFAFGPLTIFPGTYRVSVRGDNVEDTPLPTEFFFVYDALQIPATTTDLVLDVKTVDISGEVTLNGVTPALLPGCSLGSADESLHIRFTEVIHGYSFEVINVCDDGFTFGPLTIFPGTYQVSVRGDNVEDTPLPTEFYFVYDALQISTTTTGLVLDVETVEISGDVTLNGAVPALLPGCSLGSADESLHIRFTEVTDGYFFEVINVCDDGFAFGPLTIFPGTYQVSVRGDNVEDTPLPTEFYVVYDALQIPSTTTGLVLDVETVEISGEVTLNGVTPGLLPGCSLGSADESLHLRFTEVTHGYTFEVINVCDDGFDFGPLTIFPGTYRISVRGDNVEDTPLPTEFFFVYDALEIATTTTNLVLDVETLDISGVVTLNGVTPPLLPGCSLGSADESLHIRFTEVTHGYFFEVINVCDDGFDFGPLTIFPGVYRISVRGDNVEDTPLPTEFYVVYDALVLE